MKARREKYRLLMEQKKSAAPRGPRPPPGGGRGAPSGPEMEGDQMYAPRPRNFAPARELPHYAPAPMRPPPYPIRGGYGGPPNMAEYDAGMEEGYGGYGGVAQAPGLPQPGTDYPAGEFDPTDNQTVLPWRGKDVEIWAHDDQVVAGKTYRYKMRYRLKNPIFGAANASEPPALAEQFALVSAYSDWTTAMTVPSLVNFFVAGGVVRGRGTVDFEIFRWDQGQQKLERFSVGPGDLVGWEKNGIDYSTDWTVVDFREDPRANDPQILLVNNKDGSVVARSFNTDRNDRLYQALKQQVKAATEAAAAAAAAAGGVVPGANGTAAAR